MKAFEEYVFIMLLTAFVLGLIFISNYAVNNVNNKEYNIVAKAGQ